MIKSYRKTIYGLSVGFALCFCAAIALPLSGTAESVFPSDMFSAENADMRIGVASVDGNNLSGIETVSSSSVYRLDYRHTLYIADNTESDALCTIIPDLTGLVRLEIRVCDAKDPNRGFCAVLGKRAQNGVLMEDYYASAGVLGENTAGYVKDEDGIFVVDGAYALDGTRVETSSGKPISFIYDNERKDVYVATGEQKTLVRSLDGYSDVIDPVVFDGFPSGEVDFSVTAYTSVRFLDKTFSSEVTSSSFLLTELDGRNVISESEEKTFVITRNAQAYQNTVYRLPMPCSFDLLYGKRDAEGFVCTVKKMSQKPFDGPVTRDSSFVTETGTYTVQFKDPNGNAFLEYKLPTASKLPEKSSLSFLSEPKQNYGIGETVFIPCVHTINEGYLNGYTDEVFADVYSGGNLILEGLTADGKDSFTPDRAGEYRIVFRATDLFNNAVPETSVSVQVLERMHFECGRLAEYAFVGTGVEVPAVEAFQGTEEATARRRLLRPDGSEEFSDDGSTERQFVPVTAGIWRLVLTAEKDGDSYEEVREIYVYSQLSELLSADSSAVIYSGTVQRTPTYGDGSTYKGIGFAARGDNATVSYTGEIYLADNTSSDCLLELMPLVTQREGKKAAGLSNITIRLTDSANENIYVEIRITQSMTADFAYVTAGGKGQELLGINKNELSATEGTHLPFGLADSGVAGASSYTGKYDSVKLYYDNESDCVYVAPYRFVSGTEGEVDAPVLVRDLRNPDFGNALGLSLSDVKFKGFSSKSVKLSVTVNSSDPSAPAGLMILGIDGQSFDNNFGRIVRNAAPAGYASSDNLLLGEDYAFVEPVLCDVIEPSLSFNGEYVVYSQGIEVYRGKDASFRPTESGVYRVFYRDWKDSFGADGAEFFCDFTVYDRLETGIEFSNALFSGDEAKDSLTPTGIQLGARAYSNMNSGENVALFLTIRQNGTVLETVAVKENLYYVFPNSGKYLLEYRGTDCKGNEIFKQIYLDAVRIKVEFSSGNTAEEKWVIGEKRPAFVIERNNITVSDGILGNISSSSSVSVNISVLFNGEEQFTGDAYRFGNDSPIGEYTVTYTVEYTTEGVLNRDVLIRKILISYDDVPPEIFWKEGDFNYDAGSGELIVSYSEIEILDNKDIVVSLEKTEFLYGEKRGDTASEKWIEIQDGTDLSALFDRAGVYTLRFTATDEAGNIGYAWVLIDAIDYSAPVIVPQSDIERLDGAQLIEKLSAKSFVFKALTGASVLLPEAVVEDIGFSRLGYTVTIKKLAGENETDVSDLLVDGIFIPASSGMYVVEYRAVDSAGFTDKLVFVFDVRDYWLEISLNRENSVTEKTGKTILLSEANVKDYFGNEVSDARILITVKNGDKTVYEGEETAFVADGRGTYTIVYTATKNEETVYLEELMTIVDGIAPLISGPTLPKHYKSGESIDVSGFTAVDDEDGELSVSVIVTCDGRLVELEDGKFTALKGKYRVTVRAVDYTGNLTEKTYEIKKLNVAAIAWAVVGGVAVLAGVVVGTILLVKRRKRK
ncbi:MAG: hypothetical protein SPH68_06925 [Candidatus Borkfalkiaceae bacterium]|nr:hypothetical protein [Clostridia bacterium]MDY6223872.1 hypothetical protein [Christensenellaceae bacterium]